MVEKPGRYRINIQSALRCGMKFSSESTKPESSPATNDDLSDESVGTQSRGSMCRVHLAKPSLRLTSPKGRNGKSVSRTAELPQLGNNWQPVDPRTRR